LSRRHLIAFLDVNMRDDAVAFGGDLVLHLHGFDDHDALTLFHLVAGFGQHRDDSAIHRGEELRSRALRADLARAQRVFPKRRDISGDVEVQYIVRECEIRALLQTVGREPQLA
jgi:hypothetical protein